MQPLEIKISLSLPSFQPDKARQIHQAKGIAVEDKNSSDVETQMLRPDSNREYLKHTVKKGEDWFDIGEKYDVNGTELQDFNAQFTSTPLYEGAEIKIPRHFVKK